MAGRSSTSMKAAVGSSSFTITPHKVSLCILVQVYAPPGGQVLVPFPFSSVSQHNRFALFLLSLTKSCDNILEPKLDDLINQLGMLNHWLSEHLLHRLSSLLLPDDLFNLFSTLRGILSGPETAGMVDDQIIFDPNSHLGMFLRRCLLAFNLLSFEGVCHLLTSITTYYKGAYQLSGEDSLDDDVKELSDCEELEHFPLEKVTADIKGRISSGGNLMFHIHVPRPLIGFVQDLQVSSGNKRGYECKQGGDFSHNQSDALRGYGRNTGLFLRTNWQVQGYLREQADLIEKHASSFPLNAFESILKHLQRLAPELHRVHYLRYLNNLYHDDYPASFENLHCYFDFSAGAEGIDVGPSSTPFMKFGRYGTALLCLGMMHCHFGHPGQALKVLTEAVQVSQQVVLGSWVLFIAAVVVCRGSYLPQLRCCVLLGVLPTSGLVHCYRGS